MKDIFINFNKILSYNALLNMIIGERGVGKTYGITKFVTTQFIKKNHQFAYIRRYKSDLKKSCPTFFTSVINNEEFPEHNLTVKGDLFKCDDNICGYAMTLSTAQDLKSANFDKVKYIIFDEFIIDEGQKKYYLKNEVDIFLNLIETISRMRDVKIFMLGNAGNLITNPYFLYFDLHLPYNNDIVTFKNGLIALQYCKNEKYRQAKQETRFGQLVQGTTYEKYAILNQDNKLNKTFIEKKKGGARFNFAFVYNNITYGVWYDNNLGKIYVSYNYDKNTPFIFSCTLQDHTENTLFLQSAKKYRCWKFFIDNFQLGNVRYENQKIKAVTIELFKKIIL